MQFDSLGVCSAQEAHLPGEGERVTFLQENLHKENYISNKNNSPSSLFVGLLLSKFFVGYIRFV